MGLMSRPSHQGGLVDGEQASIAWGGGDTRVGETAQSFFSAWPLGDCRPALHRCGPTYQYDTDVKLFEIQRV